MNQSEELPDEGQEVHLVTQGISFTAPKRPMDLVGFHKWVASFQQDIPQLQEEQNVAKVMSQCADAFTERYLEGKEHSLIPGYVIMESSVLTKLTRGGLAFDPKVEIIPQVDHMIDLIGFCPVLTLYHIEDYYNHQNKTYKDAYLGRIKIVTLNELFY